MSGGGIFVQWAAPPGGVAPLTGRGRHGPLAQALVRSAHSVKAPQVSAAIFAARLKSAAVRPPAECVDSERITRFHWIEISG